MEPVRESAVVARMELTFELYETAEQMMRQNLRRRFPELDDREIERRLVHWLRKRPRAETNPPHVKRMGR